MLRSATILAGGMLMVVATPAFAQDNPPAPTPGADPSVLRTIRLTRTRAGEPPVDERFGLDMARFKAALDNHTHKAHVEKDMEIAKQAGVSGTPAFVVNGYFVSGAQPFPAFDKVIKLALKGS